MKTLQTFKLWLEPDTEIPQFGRLAWAIIDVSLEDVLLRGVHPWIAPEKNHGLPETLVERVNDETTKPRELESFGYACDVQMAPYSHWESSSKFERTLKHVGEGLYFVDNLQYLELLGFARKRLQDRWSHKAARALLEDAYPTFQELRQFLKSKNRRIKLSGYADLDECDLGYALSVEDFGEKEGLLISHGIPTTNFRTANWLRSVTDAQGRLRFTPEIRHFTLEHLARSPETGVIDTHLNLRAERSGRLVYLRPDVGKSRERRSAAKAFARRWRRDGGELCFQTSLEKVSEMLETNDVNVSFPTLNYGMQVRHSTARIGVDGPKVDLFCLGGIPTARFSGSDLRAVLRVHGVSMTGTKKQLLEKLARLAATRYSEVYDELEAHFASHRYVRIRGASSATELFPVLQEERSLRNLLLALYLLKHLRGNAVVDASHVNDAYTIEELALALVTDRVNIAGAFALAT